MQTQKLPSESSWKVIHASEFEKRKPQLAKPAVIDEEIKIDNNKMLLSITDTKGVITYCNQDFVDTCGYEEWELAGSPHNIIRHPDMPRFIFKFMWNRIENKHNIIAIVKNLAKDGRHYWVMTDFVIKEDEQGNITGYKAYRRPAPRKAIEAVIPLYKKLLNIEKVKGMDASQDYLIGYLESLNTTYDDFIENLIIDTVDESISETKTEEKQHLSKTEKRSFFRRLFKN